MLESGLLSEIVVLSRVIVKKKNARLKGFAGDACFLIELF
jgi:hypothetical protein